MSTWINGGEVNSTLNLDICSNFGGGSLCRDKSSDDLTFKPRPYPPPSPKFYAVLDKPGVNRHVMRGCFDIPTPTIQQAEGDDIPNLWVDNGGKVTTICDDYNGSFCDHPGRKEICKTDAPGGLADFTHPMDIKGTDYLKNGFIIEQCECSMDTSVFRDGMDIAKEGIANSNYTCWDDKHFRTRQNVLGETDKSCCFPDLNQKCLREGYKIGNENPCSWQLPGTEWEEYQDSELWSGVGNCGTWYNPPIDELPDNMKDKNNCSQYLLKWAHSCAWCKENKPTNDALKRCDSADGSCDGIRKCGGECTDTLGGLLPKTCDWHLKDDACKICDSALWDEIPGGWEALVDKENPKHLMAKFAYYPKVIKSNTTDDCLQPNAVMVDGKPVLTLDKDGNDPNNKNITTFLGLGPWFNNYTLNSRDQTQEYTSNSINNALSGYQNACTEESWVNNSELLNDGSMINISNYCNKLGKSECDTEFKCKWDNELCLPNKDNEINLRESVNWSVWNDVAVVGSPNKNVTRINSSGEEVSVMGGCGFEEGKSGDQENPRSHTVCARNHNLTGYGESDKENSYLATLWLDGKWDMSNYTGKPNDIIEEGISPETKKERKIEAIRCCLGLSPKYSTETNDYPDNVLDLTQERFKLCRPGFTCPSSDACKDLFQGMFEDDDMDYYNFGEAYPEGYKLEGSKELSDKIMENKTYYAKAYCEMMGGGTADLFGKLPVEKVDPNTDEIVGCGHDPRAEINCRKAMYNYCVEPVEVQVQDPDGVGIGIPTTKVGYPLRVFTDTCKDWCSQVKLSDSLPGQKGVCDMALGKTCQQLQVDGWIDPNNWGNSKILKFADEDGKWVETQNGDANDHSNLTAKRLRNVCGCFLMGAECGGDNCSVTYCGAGTDGSKGPGMVSFEKGSEYKPSVKEGCSNEFQNVPDGNYVNEAICDMKSVYDYDGVDKEARGWTSSIDSNEFTCVEGDRADGCFSGCNYVNYNDTCWLASPEERKQDMVFDVPAGSLTPIKEEHFGNLKNINEWPCEDKSTGDSCKTYDTNYGCFGYCGINDYTSENPRGNCGTDEWFNERMNINPGEVRYKQRKSLIEANGLDIKANVSYSWPKWQNYYSTLDEQGGQVQDPNTTYSINGWGTYTTGNDGKPATFGNAANDIDKNLCSYGPCADPDAVKPFRNYLSPKKCPSSCSVNMQSVTNNQGAVIGGINSSLNSQFACQSNADWNPSSLSSNNNAVYIGLMGENDCSNQLGVTGGDCTGCSLDSKDGSCDACKNLLGCGYGSNVCVDATKVGVDSETGEDVISGDNCNLCIAPKKNICCISPDLNPYTTSAEKVSWDTANNGTDGLIPTLGNRVSYICAADSCPNGSVNLKDLESENCGGTPCSSRDKSSCGDCTTCVWVDEDLDNLVEGHCSAQCPLPPSFSNKGWGFTLKETGSNPEYVEQPVEQPGEQPVDEQPTTTPPPPDDSGIPPTIIGLIIFLICIFVFALVVIFMS